MVSATTALDVERHHREADRLVHELVGGITYWAVDSDATPGERLCSIASLIEEYQAEIAAHNAELEDPS